MKEKLLYLTPSHKAEPVWFRPSQGLTPGLIAELEKKGRQYGIESVKSFSTRDIALGEWVNLKCRFGCSQYMANWSCPPATPDFSQVSAILEAYDTALILSGRQNRRQFYRESNRNRTDHVKYWKGSISLERLLFLKGFDKAFSLVSGACALCRKCAYPEACRFPMEKRPTVESFYIDLVGTLKNLGIHTRVAMSLNETFTYYSIILVD